jgi:hypothetical protein
MTGAGPALFDANVKAADTLSFISDESELVPRYGMGSKVAASLVNEFDDPCR